MPSEIYSYNSCYHNGKVPSNHVKETKNLCGKSAGTAEYTSVSFGKEGRLWKNANERIEPSFSTCPFHCCTSWMLL